MTQKETRLQRKEILNEKLSQVYESIMIGGTQCFLIRDGMVCRIDSIGGEYDALVIEYAENLELAKKIYLVKMETYFSWISLMKRRCWKQ